MKKQLRLIMLTLLCAVFSTVWGADEVFYTLTPANGSNHSYAGNCDITIGGITWNVTGNSQMIPWRIGGKNISNTDRAIYSKTPMNSVVSKVTAEIGTASGITVNSVKLIVASDAQFSNQLDEVSVEFSANSTLTFTPSKGTWATQAYYKFVFNVTVSNKKDNKYLQFVNAEFYNASGSVVTLKDPELSFGTTEEYTVFMRDNFAAPSLTYAEGFDGTITYTSSNENVATVSVDGSVNIVGSGSTTIKASSELTGNFLAGEASYTLNVEKKDAELAFSEVSASVILGETFTAPTLATAEDFDGTVTYSSTDESVATVSADGSVTIAGAGTTTIKAVSAETDVFLAGEASFKLTVVDPNVQEGSVTYDFMQTTYDYGSGVSSTSNSNFYITEAKTWTNTPVTLVTEGKYRWWSANNNPGDIRFHESESSTPSRMVFSVPEGYSITKVELTGEKINYWTTDGTYTSYSSNGTWEGNAQSVVFNYSKPASSPYNIIVKTAIVTFTKTTTPQPDAPVIWMTYSSNNCLDFTNATAYTAFVATNYKSEEKKVVLTKIKEVPAGVGIVIRSNDPTVGISTIFSEADVQAEENDQEYAGVNMLVGMPNGGAVSPEGLMAYDNETPAYHFVLAKRDGVVGFYKLTAGNLRANRAYLQIPKSAIDTESSANGISFAVEGEETAIQGVTTTATTDDAWYTLQGVRVAQPTRGLYIHNGKKVVVK